MRSTIKGIWFFHFSFFTFHLTPFGFFTFHFQFFTFLPCAFINSAFLGNVLSLLLLGS